VNLPGLADPIVAIFDGGSEKSIISYDVYMALDPMSRPKLQPSTESLRGLWSEARIPVGEIVILIKIPDLRVAVEYKVTVEMGMDVPLLLDSTFMAYAGIQNDFGRQELVRKGIKAKTTRRVSRANSCRGVTLQQEWFVPSHSRTLVPGVIKDRSIPVKE